MAKEREGPRVMAWKANDPEDARKIEAAARLDGTTLSEIMRTGAVREAERRLARALEAREEPAKAEGAES